MSAAPAKAKIEPIELTPETRLRPVAKPTLVIAMTPRSGSTNLCSVLAKLKTLGDPQEYFNPRGPMGHFAKVAKAPNAAHYITNIAARSDVFCFKVAAVDWTPFAARPRRIFPRARYVYLDRIDIDAQAISLFRAKVSQQWHSKAGDKNASAPPAPQFDAAGIETCRQELMQEKRRWSNFFFEANIKPLHITYEHLLSDMPRAVQKICREVGVDVAPEDVSSGDYRILRDDVTERWKKRLRKLRLETGANSAADEL